MIVELSVIHDDLKHTIAKSLNNEAQDEVENFLSSGTVIATLAEAIVNQYPFDIKISL